MTIEMWDIDRPIPYAKNARVIPQKAVDKVAASIKEFGVKQPIVVDKNGIIAVGHTRWMACKQLGLKKVPVHVATDLTPAQIRAYRLADNRTNQESGWNYPLLSAELLDMKTLDIDLSSTSFEHGEIIGAVFNGKQKRKSNGASVMQDGLEFRVVVDCTGESHQAELLARFKGDGLKCRALIS